MRDIILQSQIEWTQSSGLQDANWWYVVREHWPFLSITKFMMIMNTAAIFKRDSLRMADQATASDPFTTRCPKTDALSPWNSSFFGLGGTTIPVHHVYTWQLLIGTYSFMSFLTIIDIPSFFPSATNTAVATVASPVHRSWSPPSVARRLSDCWADLDSENSNNWRRAAVEGGWSCPGWCVHGLEWRVTMAAWFNAGCIWLWYLWWLWLMKVMIEQWLVNACQFEPRNG